MAYIRVNAESFLKGGIVQEAEVVGRIRGLLGLRAHPSHLYEDQRKKVRTYAAIRERQRHNSVRWLLPIQNSTYAQLPGRLLRNIERSCQEFLHADSNWTIAHRGLLPHAGRRQNRTAFRVRVPMHRIPAKYSKELSVGNRTS